MFTLKIIMLIILFLLIMLLFAKMRKLNNKLSRSIGALSSEMHQLASYYKTTRRNYHKATTIYNDIVYDIKGKIRRLNNFITISREHLNNLNMMMKKRNPILNAKSIIRNLDDISDKFIAFVTRKDN